MRTFYRVVTIASLTAVFVSATSLEAWGRTKGPETFLTSNEYSDGDEVVGTLLNDEEYSRMVEDIEYRDVEVDWGWTKAEYRKPRKPSRLSFDIKNCTRIRIPPVPNHSNSLSVDAEDDVREAFVRAMTRLGTKAVESGEAECRLDIAIVDDKADGTFFYFGTADPFIELEIR